MLLISELGHSKACKGDSGFSPESLGLKGRSGRVTVTFMNKKLICAEKQCVNLGEGWRIPQASQADTD